MKINFAKTFLVIGLILGLISAVILISKPDERPIGDRTFNGESEVELEYIESAKHRNKLGFGLLILSFLFQLTGVLIESKYANNQNSLR